MASQPVAFRLAALLFSSSSVVWPKRLAPPLPTSTVSTLSLSTSQFVLSWHCSRTAARYSGFSSHQLFELPNTQIALPKLLFKFRASMLRFWAAEAIRQRTSKMHLLGREKSLGDDVREEGNFPRDPL